MKDERLYARFVLDLPDHPKIMPLSDAAFRCLIEATLWSRKQMTDGFISKRLALARWGLEVLLELASNDPEKPSLIEVENGWIIHDFAEHQSTKAEIEALREARKTAGRKGGLAKGKQVLSKSSSKTEAKPKPPVSVSDSDSVVLQPSFKKEGASFFVELDGAKINVSADVRAAVQSAVPAAVLRARRTRDGLFGHTQRLLDDGATIDQLTATLEVWANRTDVYPGHLPHIYAELARAGNGARPTGQQPHKTRALADLAAQVRHMETVNGKALEA